MYVYVRLLNGFKKPLLYRLPPEWAERNLMHQIIQVPLQKRLEFAQVIAQKKEVPQQSFAVREIHELTLMPSDKHFHAFIACIAQYHQIEPLQLLQRLSSFLSPQKIDELPQEDPIKPLAYELTTDQKEIVEIIRADLAESAFKPTLLHGVTGSGKTEIYLAIIQETLKQGKSVIVLAPEITVALHLQQRLSALAGTDVLFGFHSAARPSERKKLWQQLIAHKPVIIVGVHLPILLPCSNIGLIIVDEEHEIGYQEKKHPKINSKESALMRAQQYEIPIVLGSATPSISSLYAVFHKNWRLCTLTNRFGGAFVPVETIKLDKTKRRHFFISTELQEAITSCLLPLFWLC